MKQIKDRTVEPIDDPNIEAADIFRRAGWTPKDSSWLAELCTSHLLVGTDASDIHRTRTQDDLSLIARSLHDSGFLPNRDRGLLIAFARLIGCGGEACALSSRAGHTEPTALLADSIEQVEAIARAFRSQGARFEEALRLGGWPGKYDVAAMLAATRLSRQRRSTLPSAEVPELHRLMCALVEHAGLDLAEIVSASDIIGAGSARSGPDPEIPWHIPPAINWNEPPRLDPASLVGWLIAVGPSPLQALVPMLRQLPDDAACAAFVAGIRDAIERWLHFTAGHRSEFRDAGAQLAAAVGPFLDELENRTTRAGATGKDLRKSWVWFARCMAEADATTVPEQRRRRILLLAAEELAAMRPLFARAQLRPPGNYAGVRSHGLPPIGDDRQPGDARHPWEEFEWEQDHLENCAVILYHLGGVWRGMKPLLLALRAMACPCVAPDLRYWNEPPPTRSADARKAFAPVPEPWSLIPAAMINLFHAYVGKEQASDSDLVALRSDLAAFCLRGLADRWSEEDRIAARASHRERTNQDMVERVPEWRWCMIRAAAALQINPEGKGHRILVAASRLDPDEDVRVVAHEASEKLRRAKGLPVDVSPRRAIMTALWWMRQAHLLGLGRELDPDGAQRTRAKELTRTKDQERSERSRPNNDS